LLGFDDVTDPKQFSWADDITDFSILLNRITSKKYEAKISALQQQVNTLLQTQSSVPKPLVNVLQEYSASFLNQVSNQGVKSLAHEKVRAESTLNLDLDENSRPKRRASSS
jgi:hypothetical protein